MTVCSLTTKVAIVAAMLLSGCASDSDDAHTVEKMALAGQCAPAAAYADQHFTDRGLRIYEHAYVADHCLKDKAATLSYLNLSARYGSADAQRDLAKSGKPVPAADLAPPPQSQSSGDNVATLLLLGVTAGLNGYNQGRGFGQPSPSLISTSCTTTSGITNCLSF